MRAFPKKKKLRPINYIVCVCVLVCLCVCVCASECVYEKNFKLKIVFCGNKTTVRRTPSVFRLIFRGESIWNYLNITDRYTTHIYTIQPKKSQVEKIHKNRTWLPQKVSTRSNLNLFFQKPLTTLVLQKQHPKMMVCYAFHNYHSDTSSPYII